MGYIQKAIFRNRVYGFRAEKSIWAEKVYTGGYFWKSYIEKKLLYKKRLNSGIYDFEKRRSVYNDSPENNLKVLKTIYTDSEKQGLYIVRI